MKAPLFRATLKESWRGIAIYASILLLYGMLVMALYPSIQKMASDPMATAKDISITQTGVDEEGLITFNLTWDLKIGAGEHVALGCENPAGHDIFKNFLHETNISRTYVEQSDFGNVISNSSLMSDMGTKVLYNGSLNWVEFTREDNSTYFFVIYLVGKGNFTPINISAAVSNSEMVISTAFDAYMEDNPIMEGMFGGENVDFTELDGYLSLEFFSMWPFFFVIYLGIKAGGAVAPHLDDRSMDLLLATGYSRKRFLAEKIATLGVNMGTVLGGGILGIYVGAFLVDATVPFKPLLITFAGCIPMGIAFMGLGLILSTLSSEGPKCTWGMMGIIVGMYVIQIVANLWDNPAADILAYGSFFTYWNSANIMSTGTMDVADILIPLISGLVFTWIAIYIFEKREIYA